MKCCFCRSKNVWIKTMPSAIKEKPFSFVYCGDCWGSGPKEIEVETAVEMWQNANKTNNDKVDME